LSIYRPAHHGELRLVGHAEGENSTARGIEVKGHFAFLASGTDGLLVYDIKHPSKPRKVAEVNDGGEALAVAVAGHHAWLANGTDGLRAYDITDPSQPVNIAHVQNGGTASGVVVTGHLVYLANGTGGLRIYDVTVPSRPIPVAQANDGGFARAVAVTGRFICLACEDQGLKIYFAGGPAHRLDMVSEGGKSSIAVSGLPGDVYRILGSSDLIHWEVLSGLTNWNGSVHFTDPAGMSQPARFYRAVMP